MFATIRRYEGVDAARTNEITGKVNDTLVPQLREADLAGIVVTDTVPIDPIAKPDHMTVLTVAPLLAETIMNVFADDSVSAIFGGENQLF